MNNFFLFIAALLVLALSAAFAAPQFIDWNDYRATFEEEASRVLGRPIRVGGNVDLRFLPTPYVRFERLRVADAQGRFGRPLFKADSFKMWLSVAPLMKGTIEASQIELIRPRLRLELGQRMAGGREALSPRAGANAFIPKKIALQSVAITAGEITVIGENGKPLVKLTAISGDLSASSINGPYKFNGSVNTGGTDRKIRLTSKPFTAEGALPFRTIISTPGTKARYVIDGKAIDPFGRPQIIGRLSAKMPVTLARALAPSQTNAGGNNSDRIGSGTRANGKAVVLALDLKSDLLVQSTGMKLSNVALAFEQVGRPQLLSGDIAVSWDGPLRTKARLLAKWLDLDRITGITAGTDPVMGLSSFIGQLDGLLQAAGRTSASLRIEQANLGGDVVSNLLFDVVKADGILDIKNLHAELPGRARIDARGQVAGSGDERSFDGDIDLRGGNLTQFLGWAVKTSQLPRWSLSDANDGSFILSARVNAGRGWLSVQDAAGELGSTSMTGAIQYRWRGKKSLKIRLEGPRFDAGKLLPKGVRLVSLLQRFVTGESTSQPSPRTKGSSSGTASLRTGRSMTHLAAKHLTKSLNLRIGELLTTNGSYQDVVVDVSLQDGILSVPTFQLRSNDDLVLDLSGRLSFPDHKPMGVLRGALKAVDAKALSALEQMFQLPADLRQTSDRADLVVPLALAGTMRFGGGHSGGDHSDGTAVAQETMGAAVGVQALNQMQLTLSGSAKGSRVNLFAQLDGGLPNWREQLVDVTFHAENPDVRNLLRQILPTATVDQSIEPSQGQLVFAATGVPITGLVTHSALKAQAMNASFDGRLQMARSAPALSKRGTANSPSTSGVRGTELARNGATRTLAIKQLAGQLTFDSNDARPLFVLAGLDARLAGRNTQIAGSLNISRQEQTSGPKSAARPSTVKTTLSDIQMVIAGIGLTGDGSITGLVNGRRRIVADLTADKASFMSLLGVALVPGSTTLASATFQTNGALSQLAAGTLDEASQALQQGPSGGQTLTAAGQIWPDASFSFAAIANLDAQIILKTASLQFAPDMVLSDAAMVVVLDKKRLIVRSLEGDILDGRMSAALQIDREVAGAKLKGVLRLEQIGLERLLFQPDTTTTPASGHASFTLSFAGQALSPRGLMSVVSGSGVLVLDAARLNRMDPGAVLASADAVLDQELAPEDQPDAIIEQLSARLGFGDLALGPRRIKLALADGALRAERFQIETKLGIVSATNTIDLASLKLDSEWRITPKAQISAITGEKMIALPAVTVTYVGALGQLASLEPRIDAVSLTRELTVREMERDVLELERIRQLDEQRAKAEAERQQALALEEARQRALIEAERRRALQAERAQQSAISGPVDQTVNQAPYQLPDNSASSWAVTQEPDTGPGNGSQPFDATVPSSSEGQAAITPESAAQTSATANSQPAEALNVPEPKPATNPQNEAKKAQNSKPSWSPFIEQFGGPN